MATRSLIGKRLENGNVRYIYCHWDGYPSNNGELLQENYQDEEKIDALLSEGAVSSLGAEIGEEHDFNDRGAGGGICTFYMRDRGEEDQEAEEVPFEKYARNDVRYHGAEYLYLYEDGVWKVMYAYDNSPQFDLLEEVLTKEEA